MCYAVRQRAFHSPRQNPAPLLLLRFSGTLSIIINQMIARRATGVPKCVTYFAWSSSPPPSTAAAAAHARTCHEGSRSSSPKGRKPHDRLVSITFSGAAAESVYAINISLMKTSYFRMLYDMDTFGAGARAGSRSRSQTTGCKHNS